MFREHHMDADSMKDQIPTSYHWQWTSIFPGYTHKIYSWHHPKWLCQLYLFNLFFFYMDIAADCVKCRGTSQKPEAVFVMDTSSSYSPSVFALADLKMNLVTTAAVFNAGRALNCPSEVDKCWLIAVSWLSWVSVHQWNRSHTQVSHVNTRQSQHATTACSCPCFMGDLPFAPNCPAVEVLPPTPRFCFSPSFLCSLLLFITPQTTKHLVSKIINFHPTLSLPYFTHNGWLKNAP